MATLIVIAIICLAVVFGLFFLFFKVAWLLFQKKGNLWPCILAGVATVLLMVAGVLASYKAVQRFVTPLSPIITAVQTQKQPVYGQKIYTDPTHHFQLIQFNGTVFSDWLDFDKASLLFGVDTNGLLKTNKQENNFVGFLIIRTLEEKATSAAEHMNEVLAQSEGEQIKIQQGPFPVDIGPNATASFVYAQITSPRRPNEPLPGALLIAARGQEVFYVVGVSAQPNEEVINTLQSFRFALQ